MDESWRRRQPTIQPHQATDSLGPDDFRDVFGGPPRSVLLRHFSPSTQDADNGFQIMTRDDNSPYNTVYCRPDFVATIHCGRNGFHVTKREVKTVNNTSSYQPSLATSTCYSDNIHEIAKGEEKLPMDKVLRKLDHVSTIDSTNDRPWVTKREEHASFVPVFHKQDGLSTACNGHNGFQAMERGGGSRQYTKPGLNAQKTYSAHNGFRVMKSKVGDMFTEDAFVCRPSLGQNGITSCSNNEFRALRREVGFYNDIFGSDSGDSSAGLRRSRSRSISKSESESTVVSCCEDGFSANARYGDEGDRTLASFASKLRPITIPSKRYDSSPPSTISDGDSHNTLRYAGNACPSSPLTHFRDSSNSGNSNHPNTTNKSRCTATSFCCFTPPETLSLEPSFRLSFIKPPSSEDNSPSSDISLSVPCRVKEVEKVVFEISDSIKTEEEQNFGSEASAALDEAIAWAKERFMKQDNTIEGKNENFVSFKDWNATKGKDCTHSKER